MFTNNKFAKMDSIANLINTILETDTKAKMEELKGNQHKIDKNKNNKIDAQDFKILRGEKKVEESSHQAKTTMKHVKNPTAGEKTAAKDIKPGVAGYRDRIAMLKSAEARGGLKKEETEQVDEAKEPGFRSSYGIGRKGAVAKKPETYGKRVQGKGYDKPENERKAPEGKLSITSLMPGLKIDVVGSDSFNFIHEAIVKLSNVSRDSLIEFERNTNTKTYSVIYFPEKDVVLKKKLKRNKLAQ